jgi:integrase
MLFCTCRHKNGAYARPATHLIGSKARLAYVLLLFTGCRRSDLVRLARQHVRDGLLTFTPVKGSKRRGRKIAPATVTMASRRKTGAVRVAEAGEPFEELEGATERCKLGALAMS